MTRFTIEDGRTAVVDDHDEVIRGLSPVIRGILDDTGADTVPLDFGVGGGQAQQTLEDVIRMAAAPSDVVAAEPIPWSRILAAYKLGHYLALEPAWLDAAAAFVSLSGFKLLRAFPIEDLVQWTELAGSWPELRVRQDTLPLVYCCGSLCKPWTDAAALVDVADRVAAALKQVLDACYTEERFKFLDQCVSRNFFASPSAAMRELLAGALVGRSEPEWDRIRAFHVDGLLCAGLFNDALVAASASSPRRFLNFGEIAQLLHSVGLAEEKGEMQAWCALVRDYASEDRLRDAYAHLSPEIKPAVLPHLNFHP